MRIEKKHLLLKTTDIALHAHQHICNQMKSSSGAILMQDSDCSHAIVSMWVLIVFQPACRDTLLLAG